MDRQKTEAWLKERNMHMITEDDDAAIAAIIRANLERYHLDILGTAYFDPELDPLDHIFDEMECREMVIDFSKKELEIQFCYIPGSIYAHCHKDRQAD